MKRDIPSLLDTEFDAVIIGAGVYGACVAARLSQEGYRIAIIEANDFGAGTSANSLGILHGGLRYLQHLNIKRMRRSIRARHYFMQLAPQLIDIVAFRLPLHGWGIKSPLTMRMALLLNDFISRARNKALPDEIHIPNGYVARKSADRRGWFSQLKGLNGIGIWYEAVVNHTERLVLEVLKHASDTGACIANYCAAKNLVFENNQLNGLRVKDRKTGKIGIIQTHFVIDTCGYHAGQLNQVDKKTGSGKHWARAVNVIVKGRITGDDAIALTVSDQLVDSRNIAQQGERMLFFVPQQATTLIGTFYDHQNALDAGLTLSADEQTKFLQQINQCHEELDIRPEDILRWHSGWLPTTQNEQVLELKGHSELKLQLYDQASGILDVKGVKFTTAPEVAEDVFQQLKPYLPAPPVSLSANAKTEHHSPESTFEKLLYRRYGKKYPNVATYLNQAPDYLDQIHPDVMRGEVFYACDEEMAQHLGDIMLRRFKLDLDDPPFLELADIVSSLMQEKLGWSEKKRLQEMDDLSNIVIIANQSNA